MSNWLRAQISTEIKNPKRHLFDKACEDMGYKVDYTLKEVHGSFSSEASEPVDCVLVDIKTSKPSTVGFNFRRGENNTVVLSVTGDFWSFYHNGKKFVNGHEFMKRLAMHYNREMIIESMEEQGFVIEENRVEEKEVVLIGRRMAA